MAIEVKLPELGDGITSGDVLSVMVKAGDEVKKNQGLVELETDKATVEVPSSHAGKVIRVHVANGDTVPIGGIIVTLDAAPTAAGKPKPAAPPKPAAEPEPPVAAETPPPKPAAPKASAPKPAAPPAANPKPAPAQPVAKTSGAVAAGPAVRRFAREVGVDLSQVTGTGGSGRITREDVLAAVRQGGSAAAEAADSDGFGPVRRERMTRMRKAIAAQMHTSWTTVPRVTNFDDADVTELEAFRQSSKDDYAKKGIKLTSMPFLIKAVAMGLKDHPLVNASLDTETEEIIYKDYVNIGIAVDSDRGLVVPALRDVDELAIPEIAREFMAAIDKIRNNEFGLDDLRGGTFTISNLGAIGGTYSTPIVNVPEVAILLVGRSRKMPVVKDDKIVSRLMMPMSLSYDHRLVDGATAARFLNDVIGFLEAPSRLLLAP